MSRTPSKTISSRAFSPNLLTVVLSSFVKMSGGILSKWPRDRR